MLIGRGFVVKIRSFALAILAIGFNLVLVSIGFGGNIYQVRKASLEEHKDLLGLRYDRWINAPVKDMPSRRHLLRARAHKGPQMLALAAPETIRVCAIRVEFASVPDPSKISGNGGRFDLSDKRHEIPIDPPPHDRKYFSKHMEALALYYKAMSYGHLVIKSEVFPLENDSAYVLPNVGDYNPGGGISTWTLDGLELFFKDAITVADRDPDLDFRNYDAVMVFHAGSDWQNDIRRDSPYDLPSFFITLSDSVAVEDSSYFIVDGGVVPETSSQDGFYNGLNGVVAHEFGHQLGLPDLYDTQTGISIVGYWDLMDFGSGVGVVLQDTTTDEAYFVSGVVPASLSAWSKMQLGWVVPDTAFSGTYSLDAIELQQGYPAYEVTLVPLSSREYYLIENRQRDLDGDGTGYLWSDPSEDSTGVILGPVNADRHFNYEYDFALPGSGLLIWHVDGPWTDFLMRYDIVNAFPERRGVTLVEADGIPDLGDFNSFYYLGGPDDPFRRGNNDRLADDTYPNSRTKSGCHSHVVIDEISDSGLHMSFRVAHAYGVEGFSVALGDTMRFGVPSLIVKDVDGDRRDEIYASLKRAVWNDTLGTVMWKRSEIYAYEIEDGMVGSIGVWPHRLKGSHPTEITALDFDGDGKDEIIVGDETGNLYGFLADGKPLFETSDSLGAFDNVEGGINGVPVGADINLDGRDEILVGTNNGLRIYSSTLVEPENLVPDGEHQISQPVMVGSRLGRHVVAYSPGKILVWEADTLATSPVLTEINSIPLGCEEDPGDVWMGVCDIDRDSLGTPEVVVAAASGFLWAVHLDGGELPGWGRAYGDSIKAPPAFADIDGDGYLEIILAGKDFKSWAVLRSGAIARGWPQSSQGCGFPVWSEIFYPADFTIPVASPVVGDIDGDDELEILQGSLFECIVGWNGNGDGLRGFPLGLGGGCSALALGDLYGDGRIEMVAGGGDGFLYAFVHPQSDILENPALLPWRTSYGWPNRNASYPSELMPQPVASQENLLVKGSFHGFPNPAGRKYHSTGENRVSFVFETDTGGLATLEIFDITGKLVKRRTYDVSGLGPKVELPPDGQGIDIGDLGNGLYLCRLHLEKDGKEQIDKFKLAVKR